MFIGERCQNKVILFSSKVIIFQHVGRVDDLLFFDSQPSGELPLNVPSNQDDTIDKLESYFTWSYLPIQAEDGKVGGILNKCALSLIYI